MAQKDNKIQKFTGIRLDFGSKEPSIIPAEKILPSRLDHIEHLLDLATQESPEMPDDIEIQLENMFYNPMVPGFAPGIPYSDRDREDRLYTRYEKMKNRTYKADFIIPFPPGSDSIPNIAA